MDNPMMILNPDFNVVQANELVRYKQGYMTVMEAKLLRLAISQVLQEDADFKTYSCKMTDLAAFLNIPPNNAYRTFKNIADKLLERKIYRPKGTFDKEGNPNFRSFQWVTCIDYENGICTLKLNDELKPYLLGLNALFTQYSLESILSLPTSYSIRLFELLCSYQNLLVRGEYDNRTGVEADRHEIVFDVLYLRRCFDCENKYPNTGDFVRRIISPAVKAIDSNHIMKVSFRKITSKRTITHIVFRLNDYSSPQEPTKNG